MEVVTFPMDDEVDRLATLNACHVTQNRNFIAGFWTQFRDGEMRFLIEPKNTLDHARKGNFGTTRIFAWRRHELRQSSGLLVGETKP